MRKSRLVWMTIILFSALVSGCAARLPQETPLPIPSSPASAVPELSTSTNTPLPASPPTPRLTLTPYQPIEGRVVQENMTLFEKPGYLFPLLETLSTGDTVNLLGRAPGSNWFYVTSIDGTDGWIKNVGIDFQGNYFDAPEITPQDVLVVRGRVFAPNGSPASLITVMLNPRGAQDTQMQDVAESDFTGRFYFFLPLGTSGQWTLVANDWNCGSTDATGVCGLIGQFPPPQEISLPNAAGDELEIDILP